MTKSEIVEALALEIKVDIKEAREIVKTILDMMSDALSRGDNIQLRGFGTFKIKNYESYVGHNPKTGEKTVVKPKKLPFFKVGKHLQRVVNENRFDG